MYGEEDRAEYGALSDSRFISFVVWQRVTKFDILWLYEICGDPLRCIVVMLCWSDSAPGNSNSLSSVWALLSSCRPSLPLPVSMRRCQQPSLVRHLQHDMYGCHGNVPIRLFHLRPDVLPSAIFARRRCGHRHLLVVPGNLVNESAECNVVCVGRLAVARSVECCWCRRSTRQEFDALPTVAETKNHEHCCVSAERPTVLSSIQRRQSGLG